MQCVYWLPHFVISKRSVLQDVKVWDISSGKNVFEFSGDMGKDVGIRAMDVDMAGKR